MKSALYRTILSLAVAIMLARNPVNASGRSVESILKNIALPKGFSISTYAADVQGARSLALGSEGTVFVGTRRQGKVYALVDDNRDGTTDKSFVIASGLDSPSGVAFRKGSLFVAEISRILRYDNIEKKLPSPPKPVIVYAGLPKDAHHGWKYIKFGLDGLLYVPVGAPCNICLSENPMYASVLRMKPDGTGVELFASGIRNTVGFAWHPETGVFWFTDNGRDHLGDNTPPDELNSAPRTGLHFGFPFIHGASIPDPEFGKGKKAADYRPPDVELGPHVAALGMTFYGGKMFPPEYDKKIFIAEHGSWNRSEKTGYRITVIDPSAAKGSQYRIFASGWFADGTVTGRPVDVLVMPDGALLVSDDHAGSVSRITYSSVAAI